MTEKEGRLGEWGRENDKGDGEEKKRKMGRK